MLVDANILLYAADATSRFHERARAWLEEALNGPYRVAIPWESYRAFLRIATNPRALDAPLSTATAWELVGAWMDAPVTWIPQPGPGHRDILRRLTVDLDLRANLVMDAVLAAYCIEHGLAVVSNDSDFARFGEVSWINPLG